MLEYFHGVKAYMIHRLLLYVNTTKDRVTGHLQEPPDTSATSHLPGLDRSFQVNDRTDLVWLMKENFIALELAVREESML